MEYFGKNELSFLYDLQYFAKDGPGGEKTEEPTQKKLTDARKDGQVAKSKEVGNAFGLISLFLILKIWAGTMGTQFMEVFHTIYNKIPEYSKLVNGEIAAQDYSQLIGSMLIHMLQILLPIFAIGLLVAVAGDLWQVKWKPTSKPLRPKLSKLNPIKGFKKIFSPQALVELLTSVLKIGLICYVAYSTLKDKLPVFYALYGIPLPQAIIDIGTIAIDLGLKISLVYLIVAAVDYTYQKIKFKNDMKMTKQEVKEEYKNTEGDPQIKAKIRQKMREASQRRMMQALPQADVVITNPTHFAVAIKYDPDVADAPYVVAKGSDYLAQKIKEKARESNVEIIENKPLARMLYHNVEIGALVPPELYQSVAEVLAFVYNLKNKT